jgi:hypothetical protein
MESQDKLKDDLTGRKLVYDSYFHESDRISSRTDWFLIFHAILFEAFFSIHHSISQIVTVGLVGFLCSFVWWVNGLRAYRISWQLGKLMGDENVMGDLAKMHNRIFTERRMTMDNKKDGWAKHVPLFAVITPFIFLVAWIILLIIKISIRYSTICPFIIVLVTIIVCGTIMVGSAYATWKIDGSFDKSNKPRIPFRAFFKAKAW